MSEEILGLLDPEEVSLMITACTELLARTGVREIKVEFDDRETPTTWTATGLWVVEVPDGVYDHWEVAAGMNPDQAVQRLAELICDGQGCGYCERPIVIETDPSCTHWDKFCVYLLNPVLRRFRRDCEGPDHGN